MDAEHWKNIERLYHAAMELEGGRRGAFLDQACGGDRDLRRKVETLLASGAAAGSFIESPAMEVAAQALANNPSVLGLNKDSLKSGATVAHYQILEKIGAGGMGEVYRARDTKLNRDVALKILPQRFGDDPERLSRFRREAQVLASLNHPHIAAIYGIEESDGIRALVMELVQGETLAARLGPKQPLTPSPSPQGRGWPRRAGTGEGSPLSLDIVLEYGIEIAGALAAAHRLGIIHRDLKPQNIMLTKSGTKLLDFGLAKLTNVGTPIQDDAPTDDSLTAQGAIMGTLHYMAPEQLEGKPADARTDIFAFGCVLYEMATGKRAFEGESSAQVMAAIMQNDPAPISDVGPDGVRPLGERHTPGPSEAERRSALQRAVKRCLAKDSDKRWQSVADLGEELKWIKEGEVDAAISDRRLDEIIGDQRSPLQRALPWAVAATFILATVLLTVAHFRATSVVVLPVRSYILPPEKAAFQFEFAVGGAVLSPDGTRLVFPARDSSGKELLWVRPVDSFSAQPLEGTEGASYPFWSPNSRLIGFFVPGKIEKIDVSGGPPQTVCDALNGRGGTWNADDVIVFAPDVYAGLERVAAVGGVPAPLTQLDKSRQQTTHRWPVFLPDGRHFLYWGGNISSVGATNGVYVGSLNGKDPKFLFPADSDALYAPPGSLLYLREQSLMAQPFDAGSLKLTGDAFPIAEQVWNPLGYRLGFFSVSQNGALVYATASNAQNQLAWLDANGKEIAAVGAPMSGGHFRLSPDGSRLAEAVSDPQSQKADIWLIDLARGVRTRFTFDSSSDHIYPTWSPNGNRIAFASNRKGIYVKNASGAGTEEPLLESEAFIVPSDWSRDGRFIALNYPDPKGKTKGHIWVLPMFGDRKPFPFLQTEFNEGDAVFSPDGRWLAYQSDESGNYEIYVAPFLAPGSPAGSPTGGSGPPGGKWQVSQGGGSVPTWRRDGRGLYYLGAEGKLMEAAVTPKGAAVEVGMPHEVLRARFAIIGPWARTYDVAPDGKRFLVLTSEEVTAVPLTLVTNWPALLKKQ